MDSDRPPSMYITFQIPVDDPPPTDSVQYTDKNGIKASRSYNTSLLAENATPLQSKGGTIQKMKKLEYNTFEVGPRLDVNEQSEVNEQTDREFHNQLRQQIGLWENEEFSDEEQVDKTNSDFKVDFFDDGDDYSGQESEGELIDDEDDCSSEDDSDSEED